MTIRIGWFGRDDKGQLSFVIEPQWRHTKKRLGSPT